MKTTIVLNTETPKEAEVTFEKDDAKATVTMDKKEMVEALQESLKQ